MEHRLRLLIAVAVCFLSAVPQTSVGQESIVLTPGLVIDRTVTVKPGVYVIPADAEAAISIRGNGITVNFEGVVLRGATDEVAPDAFVGTGISVEGLDITVANATVRGYNVGLHARASDGLKVVDSDFSYNFRQRLKSTIEREHLDDWMSYHNNESDEWLRYGAGIYVRDADSISIRNVRITGGQNGVMLTEVNDSEVVLSDIRFNSGIGIGLYRSSRNRIQSNRLDWNVRGHSEGYYNRGQDSAALLLYEQSSENIIAFNSATHSGDGLFLWAGQTTMDTGAGGCNDNLIVGNDFSYAPTNGIEVTFSRNRITGNRIAGCWHGIWGGYSYDTVVEGNTFIDNEEHVAIEHGQNVRFAYNTFAGGDQGLRVWERPTQPADWGYASARDVASRDYTVEYNSFAGVGLPLNVTYTGTLTVSGNVFEGAIDSMAFDGSTSVRFIGNTWPDSLDHAAISGLDPSSLQVVRRGANQIAGPAVDRRVASGPPFDDPRQPRHYILVDEWGPVDFRSPAIWPRSDRQGRVQRFEIVGPTGTWRIVEMRGIEDVSAHEGVVGDFVEATVESDGIIDILLRLEYVGTEVTDRFGRTFPAGQPFGFDYAYSFVPLQWDVRFFEYDAESDPREQYDGFRRLIAGEPVHAERVDGLAYQAFRSPAPGVRADRYATVATANLEVPGGVYVLDLTSDDGVRVWLDGEVVHDDWTYHAPRLAEVELGLNGVHELRIEHFEIDGYSTLVASLRKRADEP